MARWVQGLSCAVLLLASSNAGIVSGAYQPAPILSSSRTIHRVVALTFDDGPSPYTEGVLAALRRYHATATFFVVGSHAAANPRMLVEEQALGAQIGNHTYTHADLRFYSDEAARAQLSMTQAVIWSATHTRSHWFRPPYGGVDQHVADLADSLGLHTVLWSVDPRDWSLPGPEAIAFRVLSAVRPGSIVIMHDGGGYRGETVQALPLILEGLRREGYRFITLDEMFFPVEAARPRPSPTTTATRSARPAHG